MRRFYFIGFLALLFSRGYSQDIDFGVQGGLNLSGGIAREGSALIKGNPGIGFALGGFADVYLGNKKFSIRPILSFQHEASRADIFENETNIRVNYINLPVDLVYHSDLAQNRLQFAIGPYIGYALS
jgi:hypothetical protein